MSIARSRARSTGSRSGRARCRSARSRPRSGSRSGGRLFEERVGLRPKRLARVLRFQRVLRRLEREPRLTWSALAAEHGYFDQSHFIKEFGALSGMRPTQYLQDKGEYFNFVPIR